MSCNSMRIIQRQRINEDEEAKKKKKAKAKKRIDRMNSKKIIKKQAEKFGWIVKDKSLWTMTLQKPNSKDVIEVELMNKNLIKFTVPGIISGVNHANAENFLQTVTTVLGAKVLQMVHNVKAGLAHAVGLHHHDHTHA